MNCDNKNKYFSEDEAESAAQHEFKIRNIKLRTYHCSDCGWWHLTKNLNFSSFIKKNKYKSKPSKKSFKDLFDESRRTPK